MARTKLIAKKQATTRPKFTLAIRKHVPGVQPAVKKAFKHRPNYHNKKMFRLYLNRGLDVSRPVQFSPFVRLIRDYAFNISTNVRMRRSVSEHIRAFVCKKAIRVIELAALFKQNRCERISYNKMKKALIYELEEPQNANLKAYFFEEYSKTNPSETENFYQVV